MKEDKNDLGLAEVPVLSIWMDDQGVCISRGDSPAVYVYGTKRSAFNALERMFDGTYKVAFKEE